MNWTTEEDEYMSLEFRGGNLAVVINLGFVSLSIIFKTMEASCDHIGGECTS